MLLLAVLAALLAFALGWQPKGCGYLGSTLLKRMDEGRMKRSSMILGGGKVMSHEVPWMIRVDADNRHICTGTLISKNHVLTAAHCFVEKNIVTKTCTKDPSKFTVCLHRTFNTDECPDDSRIEINETILHLSTYMSEKCSSYYDFVVLQLLKPVNIDPVCLPIKSNGIIPDHEYNQNVFLFGYSANKDINPRGRAVNTNLKVVNAGIPDANFAKRVLLRTSHQNGNIAICQGDSGGPMVEVHDGTAILVGVNVNSDWSCDINRLDLDKDKTEHYQRAVAVLPRLNNLNGTLFPKFD